MTVGQLIGCCVLRFNPNKDLWETHTEHTLSEKKMLTLALICLVYCSFIVAKWNKVYLILFVYVNLSGECYNKTF